MCMKAGKIMKDTKLTGRWKKWRAGMGRSGLCNVSGDYRARGGAI